MLSYAESGHGRAVSLQLIGVGKPHGSVLLMIPVQPQLISFPGGLAN
jgi:hypothetical protein